MAIISLRRLIDWCLVAGLVQGRIHEQSSERWIWSPCVLPDQQGYRRVFAPSTRGPAAGDGLIQACVYQWLEMHRSYSWMVISRFRFRRRVDVVVVSNCAGSEWMSCDCVVFVGGVWAKCSGRVRVVDDEWGHGARLSLYPRGDVDHEELGCSAWRQKVGWNEERIICDHVCVEEPGQPSMEDDSCW